MGMLILICLFLYDSISYMRYKGGDIMEPEKKKNAARMSLRRYLALVGNVELRKKVFGF